ncbi:diaminobutyrate acetyltransferase [Herminiimonas fonticola]|uniref:diaminobutyrate acetyltransferase n=1 Tax=Herminiimonas fonticola TaxID=303380 RepID=UPI00333E5234
MNVRVRASAASNQIVLRLPERRDGADLHELIAHCPPLDLNSRYAYLLLCEHHAATSVVAQIKGRLIGAITAYVPPTQPGTLFIWQVAVAPNMQGQRLGSRMLDHLVERCARSCGVQQIAATISPSNIGSQNLFKSYARRHHADIQAQPYLTAVDFGDGQHEEEWLYQISPVRVQSNCVVTTIPSTIHQEKHDAYIQST